MQSVPVYTQLSLVLVPYWGMARGWVCLGGWLHTILR